MQASLHHRGREAESRDVPGVDGLGGAPSSSHCSGRYLANGVRLLRAARLQEGQQRPEQAK